MTDDDTRRAFVILGAALLVGAAVPAAQNAPRERAPEFEVASVKANESGAGQRSVGFQPGGRFVARNMTLRGLVAAGYGAPQPLPLYRVVGGPGWVDADRFEPLHLPCSLDPGGEASIPQWNTRCAPDRRIDPDPPPGSILTSKVGRSAETGRRRARRDFALSPRLRRTPR